MSINQLFNQSINQSINWFIYMAARKLDWNKCTTRVLQFVFCSKYLTKIIISVIVLSPLTMQSEGHRINNFHGQSYRGWWWFWLKFLTWTAPYIKISWPWLVTTKMTDTDYDSCLPRVCQPHLAETAFAQNLDEVEVWRTVSALVWGRLGDPLFSITCSALVSFFAGQHLNKQETHQEMR